MASRKKKSSIFAYNASLSPTARSAAARKAVRARWDRLTAEQRREWRRKQPGLRAWKGAAA